MHKLSILLLLVIASRSTAAVATQYNAVFKAQTGWDIYTGGVYRYGPSIIENNDGSIDAWFAAPGGQFGEMILYYNDSGVPYPVGLSIENTAAQKFIAVDPFYAINVFCPAWGSSNSSLTFSLYRWQTDYNTTLASAALLTK
ncbi:unnamed protein product, partial [Adineta steineri]